MRKLVLTLLILSLTTGTSFADAPDLTFSDFIPIVQAPSEKREELRIVKSPDAVTSETCEVEVDGKKSQYLSLRGKTSSLCKKVCFDEINSLQILRRIVFIHRKLYRLRIKVA